MKVNHMRPNSDHVLMEFFNIFKRYPGVQALSDISLEINKGEVRALVGENGAGKSTFVNVIGGVVKPDEGTIKLEGNEIRINSPAQADEHGISIVHQELSLFPNLDVATNLFISSLDVINPYFVMDQQMREKAKEILERVGLAHIPPSRKVKMLQPGEQQLVEIGRSLVKQCKLLVLDEPTSSLSDKEIQTLFSIIRELKKEDISIVFVSHRLDEIFEICDRVTVFRDGKHIETINTSDIDNAALVQLILGRKMSEMYNEKTEKTYGESLLRVENLWNQPKLCGLSFELKAGEILGISGLLGSGRTELMRAIFGLDKFEQGQIYLKNQPVKIQSPKQAIKMGIGYITEDRHKEGLILDKSISDNIVLASLRQFANWFGWMMPRKEIKAAEQHKAGLNIVTPSVFRRVQYLSGGNQQKVVLSKWLETNPDIYILDEPTRGIDVGAKAEFYNLINELADKGAGVILISSDLPEIINICDRVLVLRNGNFVADFTKEKINAAEILLAATGG